MDKCCGRPMVMVGKRLAQCEQCGNSMVVTS
jgi:hypothetical protein